MAVSRFEDLVAWKRAMGLCTQGHRSTREGELGRDRVLSDQMWRAAVSVPSNIAEGFERFTRTEFGRFLAIAKGSCGELRCQLLIAKEVGLLGPQVASTLIDEAEQVGRLVGALKSSLTRGKSN